MMHLSEDERTEVRDTVRRFLTDRSSTARVRELLEDTTGHDSSVWTAMAELGWLAIHVPDEHGGMGASHSDLAIVLHELGRQLTPSPMLGSAVLGAGALTASTNTGLAAAFLPSVVSGETVLTTALSGATGSYEPSQLTVRFEVRNGAVVLSGMSRYVPDAHVADQIVVSAVDASGGVTMAVVDAAASGVQIAVEPTFDQTRRLATVTLEDVTVGDDRLLGQPGKDAEQHVSLVALGAIAVMCDAVGAAEHILEISTQYAKERHQFGRPIGSFQAVKHHLANMFTDVEASRAAVDHAVDVLDSGGAVRQAAAIAKSFAGPACSRVAGQAIQVHGGIGFTWEHDAHLFLKRVRLDEALFGSARWHRQHLATLLVDERIPL